MRVALDHPRRIAVVVRATPRARLAGGARTPSSVSARVVAARSRRKNTRCACLQVDRRARAGRSPSRPCLPRNSASAWMRVLHRCGRPRRSARRAARRRATAARSSSAPWQGELPAGAVDLVRAGHDLQRDLEVVRAARQRSDHGDVRLAQVRRQGLALRRADAEGRLVAEDAAVVGRVADRGADVAAGLEPGQAGGERRCRAAGRAARARARRPRGCWWCRRSG